MKTVSVVMCTYNGASYLRQQLDTIINQTYPIHELIVQDDQSTDDTMVILEEYAARYPFMQIYRKQQRKGINDNFYSAMAYATGDYIALSDQDDVWEPTKIEEQINAIGDNWICFHKSPHFKGDFSNKRIVSWDKRIPNYSLVRMYFAGIYGHTMLLKTSFYSNVMRHVSVEKRQQIAPFIFYDTIMAIVANAYQKIVYINRPLTWHRRLKTSATESEERRDLSKRSWMNAVRLVLRNLNCRQRKAIKPYIRGRFEGILMLLDCFPDAPYTAGARKLGNAFLKHEMCGLRFVIELVKNRNKIFYAPEKIQWVAVLRALFMPITMYDSFSVALRYKKEGRPDA